MNTQKTKEFVTSNGIVALKADKSLDEKNIDEILRKLGNTSGAIPFYAIFPAGRPNEPILMDGLLSETRIIEALQKALPSSGVGDAAATAMRAP